MKKTFMTICALCCCVLAVNAKNPQNSYGPLAGDMALTFNATPVVNFIGNMFNNTEDNSIDGLDGNGVSAFNGCTVSMKSYITDNIAFDAGIGINISQSTSYRYNNSGQLNQKNMDSDNAFMVKGGFTRSFRSLARVQPYVSLDAMYARSATNEQGTYDMTSDSYKTVSKNPSNNAGLICTAGVEYFLNTCVSLGMCVDLALVHSWSRSKYTNSDSSGSNSSHRTDSSNTIATGHYGSGLTLNFYF